MNVLHSDELVSARSLAQAPPIFPALFRKRYPYQRAAEKS
jgi:hypothetical protein